MNTENLKTRLQDILNNKPASIQAIVAQEALERDNPQDFLRRINTIRLCKRYGLFSYLLP